MHDFWVTGRAVLAFLVALGVLVFFHELGHYLAARWRGVRVDVFSIGFGKALWQWQDKAGTVWKIAVLPLGGYVKLHGHMFSESETASLIKGQVFYEKPVLSRAIIVASGPLANFILAFLLFFAVFATAGLPGILPVVTATEPHTAAAAAKLVPGDKILAVNGEKIKDFTQLAQIIEAKPGQKVFLTLQTKEGFKVQSVVLGQKEFEGKAYGFLGIEGGTQGFVRKVPLFESVKAAGYAVYGTVKMIFFGLIRLFSHPKTIKDLGGPVQIAQLSGQAAHQGVARFIEFMALLSVNLGLLNLVPIPALDGGHLLFYVIEAVARRPVPQKIQEYILFTGAVFLILLLLWITFQDVLRLHMMSFLGH